MRSRVIRSMAIAVCTLALSAGTVWAKKPTVKNRQGAQVARVRQGVANGSVTRPEARRLSVNQARIHRSVVRDRVDGGVFTPRERAQAQHKLNRQSRAIAHQKHDNQNQP